MPNQIYRFKIPFLDCTTIDKEGKFIQRDLNFNKDNFPELFADNDMSKLAQTLIDASRIQFNSINKENSPVVKRNDFLEWLRLSSPENNKFSL